MHQSLTISMLISLRRNISWMSSKSNMISVIPTVRNPKTSEGYLAQRLVRWSLHALLYQVCILFIKPGQSCNKEWGRKSLPYSNFFGQSSKSAMSSTPIFLMKLWSVRGSKTPDHLVALESETFFYFSHALSVDFSFNICLVLAACHLFTISESSFWYDRITRWTGNPSICCCCCGWWSGVVCARGGDAWGAGAGEGASAGSGEAWATGGGDARAGGGEAAVGDGAAGT